MLREHNKDPSREPDPELDRLAHAVIGAAIEVHRHLGSGHWERTYEKGLLRELVLRGIQADNQHRVAVMYKGGVIGRGRTDLLVERKLLVEIKATHQISPVHVSQVISYLKTTGLHLALILNFNVPRLRNGIRRVILSDPKPP